MAEPDHDLIKGLPFNDPFVICLLEANPHHFPPNNGSPIVRKIDGEIKWLIRPITLPVRCSWTPFKGSPGMGFKIDGGIKEPRIHAIACAG
jgi:hypothetical protein